MEQQPTDSNQPEILHYQRDRRLNEVSGLPVGLQLQLSSGGRMYVATSATDLGLYSEDDFVLHYDLEGRLTKVAHVNEYWRRSLSNRVLYSRKPAAEVGGGLERAVLSEADAEAVVARSHEWARSVYSDLRDGKATIEFGKPDVETARTQLLPVLAKAAAFDSPAARASAQRFTDIYGRVAVLPSDQYNALVLQVTSGCGFSACLFCELYKGVRYHVKTDEEFRQHVQDAVAFHGEGLRTRRMIYLGEANALQAPQRVLADHLRYLNEVFAFPAPTEQHVPANWWLGRKMNFEGIASFLDVFTGEPRTAMDYTELRRLGLRRVYLGMETGCDALLHWLRKPAKQELIHQVVRTLKEADIRVGAIILLGAGGTQFYRAHVQETIDSLSAMGLGKGDYIYFSPLIIYPGGPYDERMQESGLQCLTEDQMKGQELEIRAGLRFDERRGRPYLARYELDTFVY